MKFKKYLPIIMKFGGCVMTLALVVANFSQSSTCFAMYHQPKVPKSLLETNEE